MRAGFNARGSLSFLMVLNGGAVVGALLGSKVADCFGRSWWSPRRGLPRCPQWPLYVNSSRPIDPKQPLVYIASC